MNWNSWMERAQNIHMTARDWLQVVGDSTGITVTTLWLVGVIDGTLHTVIALVTLASVSFTLYTKVCKHVKDINKKDYE